MTNDNAQDQRQTPEPNPALKRLDALAGEWNIEGSYPLDPTATVDGRTSFEWLEAGAFLVHRGEVADPDFPNSTAIIGCDDANGTYSMLYFDSRGVSRIYAMSLSDDVWMMWRESPGFSQRFTGEFSDNGTTITGRWERSSDGLNWEHDFDLTYRKVT